MAVATAQQRENLAVAYAAAATHAALFTTQPSGSTPGTEVTGGSPAYARKAISWSQGAVDGQVTAQVVFDVPSGVTVRGAGLYTAVTGGTYLDGVTVTDQAFASQGTYTLTLTFTQS